MVDMMINEEAPEAAAENWDLPLAAIQEVIEYCQSHAKLLQKEAREERRRLEEKGISLEQRTQSLNQYNTVEDFSFLQILEEKPNR
jgi:hypothetical protein